MPLMFVSETVYKSEGTEAWVHFIISIELFWHGFFGMQIKEEWKIDISL